MIFDSPKPANGKKSKGFLIKTLAEDEMKSRIFRNRKEELKMKLTHDFEIPFKKTLRKYTTNSPEMKDPKKGKFRQSAERYEDSEFKLPTIHTPIKKSPLIVSLNSLDIHSKSLSPSKAKQGRINGSQRETTKTSLPSKIFCFRERKILLRTTRPETLKPKGGIFGEMVFLLPTIYFLKLFFFRFIVFMPVFNEKIKKVLRKRKPQLFAIILTQHLSFKVRPFYKHFKINDTVKTQSNPSAFPAVSAVFLHGRVPAGVPSPYRSSSP